MLVKIAHYSEAIAQSHHFHPELFNLLISEIAYHKVGKHRRIFAKDLYKYKANIDAKRSQSLDELTALSEELDLYEDD